MGVQNMQLQADFKGIEQTYFTTQKHTSLKEVLVHSYVSGWHTEEGLNLMLFTFSSGLVYGANESGADFIAHQLTVDKGDGSKASPRVMDIDRFGSVRDVEEGLKDYFSQQQDDLLIVQCEMKNPDSLRKFMHVRYLIVSFRAKNGRRAPAGPGNATSDGGNNNVNHGIVLVAHMSKSDSLQGCVQPLSLQYSAKWHYATVDSWLEDPDTPSMQFMLEASVADIVKPPKQGEDAKMNISTILKNNMRHCVAKLAYPSEVRPDVLEQLTQLERLLDSDRDFQLAVRVKLAQMVTGDSLKPGWQSRIEPRAIAAAGTYTRALSRALNSLVITAFTNFMGKVDVNQNVALYDSLSNGGLRALWMKIVMDPNERLLQFPVVITKMEGQSVDMHDNSFVPFKGSFPFSWLIHAKVTSSITSSDNVEGLRSGNDDVIEQFKGQYGATSMGSIVSELSKDDCMLYLNDAACLTHFSGLPVNNYRKIVVKLAQAQGSDAQIAMDHVVDVHQALLGIEQICTLVLDLESVMQSDGILQTDDLVQMYNSLFNKQAQLPAGDGSKVLKVVELYVEYALSTMVANLNGHGLIRLLSNGAKRPQTIPDQQRLADFSRRVQLYGSALEKIFSWAAEMYAPGLPVSHCKMLQLRLLADYCDMVLVPLNLGNQASIFLERFDHIVNKFDLRTLYFISAQLADLSHGDTRKREKLGLAFLEHYMMNYAFDPVVVGTNGPDKDVIATLTYASSLSREFTPQTDKNDQQRARVQEAFSMNVKRICQRTDVEFSGACRVSLMGHILSIGLNAENETIDQDTIKLVDERIGTILDDPRWRQSEENPLDNSFAVLVMQTLEDRLAKQATTTMPELPDDVQLDELPTEERHKTLLALYTLLAEWAENATTELAGTDAKLLSDPAALFNFLKAIAKLRIVVRHVAAEVMRGERMPTGSSPDQLLVVAKELFKVGLGPDYDHEGHSMSCL